jgi:bis(5'-nucleosidyl)-tetraphosphatase
MPPGPAGVLSSGVVVVRRDRDGCRFLLLRAYRYWDFPKGEVEPGEDPLGAARREVREETGLAQLRFTWGEVYRETAPYGRGKVARYYLAETAEERVVLGVNPALGHPEHHEYRWLSLGQARSLLVPRVAQVLDWAARVAGCEGGPPGP